MIRPVRNQIQYRMEKERHIEEISIYEVPNIFRFQLESSLRKYGIWKPKFSKIEPIPINE
jgi:uncharacterized protein involved in tolerance to divalent cations